ncbi:cytochrome P450 [Aspergillus mulundensis]|uniref:Putative Cytochrome P450 n=1 Tax=Aspergillus mulundensis TaxID=1810919 RepID=A0A3D8SXW0_9EURO|nr:putative Cytochrome P450 [Aspergillus mulundensis]RDW90608.1 putative Cytochrome P450 [Aspergillus mulundensis]
MLSICAILALAACLLILQYARSNWIHARMARDWGCAPLPRYPTDVLGLTTLRESIQADKEKRIPLLLQRRLEMMSAREKRPVTTFVIRQMGLDNIFTCDHANVQAILATKFKDFELGAGRRHTLYPMFGVGIFTSDGETWSRSRALLRPQFTRDQISDLELEEKHVQQAMLAMPVDPTTGWTANTNIQDIIFRLTIDSATEFLFGESAGSQAEALRNGGTLPPDHFSGDFDRGQWYVAQRSRFEKFHWLVDNRESRAVVQRIHDYVDRFVHAALAASEAGAEKQSESDNYVFLEALAATTKDPIELRSQLLNILLAGRDTTASLLSWSLLMLARHHAVFAKLRATILSAFGPYTTRKTITFTSLKSCRYLQHFLAEVLRLYPAVPVNRRVATTPTSLPSGGGPTGTQPIYLRAGQVVTYSPFITHRRKDLWGEDAETFNPDRWVDRKVGWEYLPFNGGPRMCIGQQFALTEAGYVLVRLLQRFDGIVDCFPGREVRYGLTLTLAPGDGVVVRLHEAE